MHKKAYAYIRFSTPSRCFSCSTNAKLPTLLIVLHSTTINRGGMITIFPTRSLAAFSPIKLTGSPACKRAITTEAALRIGAIVGNGARIWLSMQMEFDLWEAEQTLHDELIAIAA